MSEIDPIFATVTAPGTPFEIGERNGIRHFVNAPPDLNLLIESARRYGDKTFIVEDERRLSFNDMFALRDALAARLGTRRGDMVAICMRNRAEWMIAYLAIVRAGGVAILFGSRGSPAELAAMAEDSTPVAILADSERARLLREGGYEGLIIDLADPATGLFGTMEIPAIHDATTTDGAEPTNTLASPGDPVSILFTSGTTGRGKGVVLSHLSLSTGLLSMQLAGMMVVHNMARTLNLPLETILANVPQQAVLLVYPLFHISGLGSAFLAPFFAGSKVVIMRRWDPEEALKLIEREQVTMFTGVPTMLWDVLHRARLADADLSSLRNIASGGQALPVKLLEDIREACPQAYMGTGYGMTECSGSVAQAVGQDFVRKPASAGRVSPLVEMRIEGPNGEDLPRGKTGEIIVRGAQIMTGYWNRSEETAAVLAPDGWLRTGDVGYIDEEGYIFIVDRKKDMVISGGENIYCAEVEGVMGRMAGMIECAAFGIPDERLGEMLVAVVVANGLTEDMIRHEVGERLARFKAPGRVIFSETPLPRNAIGKLDKVALRALWPELIGD